jgi:F0F1-type ATP synthase membrane subunit c/vacuolar-type H+-ATPase subunit K
MAGTPITGTPTWNTPAVYNSTGAVLASADYNKLAGDVALVYAKPFLLINQQSAVTPTSSPYNLFQSAVTVGQTGNSPASGVGSITYSAAGSSLQAPLTGLYRISCAVTIKAGLSTGVSAYIKAVGQNGVTSNVAFNGSYVQGDTLNGTSTLSFIYPMEALGTSSPARPTSWFFSINYNGAISTLPAGSATSFLTWASLEYLGSSGTF